MKQKHYSETITSQVNLGGGNYAKAQTAESIHVKQVVKIACNVKINNPALATV